MLFKSVVFLTLIYVCCDLFECINIKRYDVHRILLKARNRGRYKKTPFRSPYSAYQRQLKQPYLTRYNQHWKPQVNEDVLTNLSHSHHNKYKDHNRFKKHKNTHTKSETVARDNLNYLRNPKYNLYHEPQIKFLNPSNTHEINYRAFQKFKGMLNYYNAKEEEEYRKRIQQAKQQENGQAHSWNTLNEPLSQEETDDYNVWKPPESNEFKVTWKPISENKKPRLNSAKHIKNGFGTQYKDLAYTIVLTTSKPRILPETIVERDEVNDIHPMQESHEFLPDDSHSSYEISEDTNTISPAIANFQNVSYSTLWNQVRGNTLDTKKKHTSNVQEGTRLKIKKPIYSTIYHNY